MSRRPTYPWILRYCGAAALGAAALIPISAQSQTQAIELFATCNGAYTANVQCTLQNAESRVTVQLPAAAEVKRSASDLLIQCTKRSSQTQAVFQSRSAGGLWGKLGSWGGQEFASRSGALDLSKFDYPPRLIVEMPPPCE